MVRVERKINKKIIISLVLLVALVFLIVASVLLNLLGNDTTGGTGTKNPPLEVLAGESKLSNINLAYPQISDAAIQRIEVSDSKNSYALARHQNTSSLELWYPGEDGKLTQHYFPDILTYSRSSDYDYDSLYAIESEDTTGLGMGVIPILSWVCTAVGTTAFQARIELSDEPEKRAAQLESFGFTEAEIVTIKVDYTVEATKEGEEPKTESHTLDIGKKTVAGSGRYFRVDDRDYIYCSYYNYFEYALQGFASFIKPYIVVEGLDGQAGAYAAYFTQEFSQWKNTKHDNLGDVVEAGAQVIVDVQTVLPDDPWNPSNKVAADGYLYSDFTKEIFNLSDMKNDPDYSRLIASLVGKSVGTYFNYKESTDESGAISFTLTSPSKLLHFDDKESLAYEYEIHYIESLLTDTTETFEAGTPVGEHKLVKVGYSFKVDGVEIGKNSHAVVDLDDERIPADARAALAAASVGDLNKSIKFSIDYTKDNARKYEIKYVIRDIIGVYDKNGKATSKITKDSIVKYSYYLEVNGEKYDEIMSDMLSLADPEDAGAEDEATTLLRQSLRNNLIGKTVSYDINTPVMSYTEYNEALYDFVTYRVAEIYYYVTSELVTSFGYVNTSDRDGFFAEVYYKNLMPGKNSLYGINGDACISVIQYFMGITSDSSNSTSSATGLVGSETVAIGLTPDNMDKYGLHAYTIRIELPRSFYERNDANAEDENDVSNFVVEGTLTFNLYISEEQVDGTRYIGSDMYDIIAVIDGEMFEFLEYDFAEFWARRHLLLVDYLDIENMKFSFNMDDLKGEYNIDVKHGSLYLKNGEEVSATDDYDAYYAISDVIVSQSGECRDTVFSKYLTEKGLNSITLQELYDNVRGDGNRVLMGERDYLGSANYRTFMYLIFGIKYTDYISDLTEEEKGAIRSGAPMMSMSLALKDEVLPYVYEFHRIDDRRVMVTLYKSGAKDVAVSDFYISTSAFKKLVGSFFDVLNVNDVNPEGSYPEIN